MAAGTHRRPDPRRQRTGQRRHDGRENRRTGAPTQRVRPPQRSSLSRRRPPTQRLAHQERKTTNRSGRALANRQNQGRRCSSSIITATSSASSKRHGRRRTSGIRDDPNHRRHPARCHRASERTLSARRLVAGPARPSCSTAIIIDPRSTEVNGLGGRRRRLSTSLKVDLTVAASKARCAWSSNGIVSASMVLRPPTE